MRRIALVFACLIAIGATGFTQPKIIGYYMNVADDYYKAGYQVFTALATKAGWRVHDVVGHGTAPEQLTAVKNFITHKVDALIVVQNSAQTTSEALKEAYAAKIPYFALTHKPPNEPGLAGFSGFDMVYDGHLAGKSAIKHGVKRVIIIEGKHGQGTSAGQTQGFLEEYRDQGKDIGNLLQAVREKGAGGKDLRVVFWGSEGDPARKVMQDAITALGPNGFNGAYVEDDEMMAGALQAIQEAGLDSSKYWLGSSNGKEKSWAWVEDGLTTMDISRTPTLEADIAYQQIKAYFAGKPYKKGVFVQLMPFEKSALKLSRMIPWLTGNYMAKRAAKAFIFDIDNPVFQKDPAYE
ncbi:MAG: sugar ABC transporter substrate-binding protein [Spirochaetia bacterium]